MEKYIKEINQLKEEINRLNEIIKLKFDGDETLRICKIQIAFLEKEANTRVLTLEETKKLEILNKLLEKSLNSKRDDESDKELSSLDDQSLLKLVKFDEV